MYLSPLSITTETKPQKYRTTTKKRYVESKGGAQSFGSHSGDLDSTAVSNSFPKLNISLGGPDVIFVTSKIAASGSSAAVETASKGTYCSHLRR